ncbi:MAG: DNA polymerase III subunit epsilon [Gammaproteobacteria bacterium]|nr:DNA polymerase III subunit epsilon [Gammaproteobacteria bacterium]
MRQIVLDTETTGLEHSDGHRIIEIGCVEVKNRAITGENFHKYLQPDRHIDEGAIAVHGISNEFLADKPRFEDIMREFIGFIDGAELIIHNAAFDVGFINAEFKRAGHAKRVEDHCTILDTLALARETWPGQRNSLDALCKRLEISNAHRTLHGALLDSEILADVYLRMTGGQTDLLLEQDGSAEGQGEEKMQAFSATGTRKLRVVKAGDAELQEHRQWLEKLAKESAGGCLWDS